MKAGKTMQFRCRMNVDLETFPKDKEYNYELTEADLKNPKLKAEFFCSDCNADEEEDVFDFDNAKMVLYINEKRTKIKVEFE